MMIHPDEAAFLSEISELLGDCEAPAAPEAVRHGPTIVTGPEGLLFASHRLVAETEALLSSCSTPSSKTLQRTETLAERRKIRNANAAKRRLKYCKKIENEREQLRQQEKELEVELAELQAKQSERYVETRSMPVWQAVATRQLQSRIAAEAERRRLRDIVATRTKLLRELGEKMQLHVQGAHQDDRDAGQSGPPLTPEDTVLFEIYIREMDEAYNQVGSILNAWGVRGASLASFHPDSKRLHDGNMEYYESLGVQLTPFNSQQTGAALWQAMRLFHRQKCRLQYRGVSDPENMLAVKFRVPDSEKSANLMIRIVLRKWTEAEQTVILWRAHTQGEGELSHFQADETGWSVVRPTDPNSRRELGMPTAILTFIRVFPCGEATETGEDKSNIEQFLHLAESSGNEDGSEVVRMMESLLLDDARST